MNTCKTCKWWGYCAPEWEGSSYDDLCQGIDHKPCSHPKMPNDGAIDPDGATVHKSIDSTFCTGPDFGCIHHETQ